MLLNAYLGTVAYAHNQVICVAVAANLSPGPPFTTGSYVFHSGSDQLGTVGDELVSHRIAVSRRDSTDPCLVAVRPGL